MLVQAGIESKLFIEGAELITQFESEIDDYPEYVCCSCECLYQRKYLTKVKLSNNPSSHVWPRLSLFYAAKIPPLIRKTCGT